MDFIWNTQKEINDDNNDLKSAISVKEDDQVSEYAFSLSRSRSTSTSANSRLRYTPSVRPRADTMPTSSPFDLYNPSTNIDNSPFLSDENVPNSLTSTLASLGLTDDDSSISSGLTRHYFEPTTAVATAAAAAAAAATRNRSYTVSDMVQRRPFKPFLTDNTKEQVSTASLQTHHRPRAASLGMAEISHHHFSPFDFDYFDPSIHEGSKTDNSSLYSAIEKTREDESMTKNDSRLSSPSLSAQQTPSRALWLGNISPSVKVSDLYQQFSSYGHIESARILSDKDCAFVNFESIESALAAKEDLEGRWGSKVKGSVVKVGFGKADVNLAVALANESSPNVQGPTRALWVGNIPTNTSSTLLQTVFESFGPIESIRILSHKNCAFINFHRQEDAVRARKTLQNKEILGPGTGTVRVGFAREPEGEDIAAATATKSRHQENANILASILSDVNKIMSEKQAINQDQRQVLSLERKLIMQRLGYTPPDEDRVPIQYSSFMPPVPEFNSDRKVRPLRLREIRKGLDTGLLLSEIESIAEECMEEIVELCSDYIGNTVVQKIFEYGSEDTKLALLKTIAPYLASIGVHKNGTWAAQKIIDTCHTEEQVQLICTHLAPYVPLLLLDQFGNYVVQCCLRMGYPRNQFIFYAIADNCLVVGQGRFGSRSIRAILGNPIVTKEQQVYIGNTYNTQKY
ncbi:hypothetical protein RMCBS344292_16622 [Rhizopus microsporus]|nr:hypothetical protein RMCBS344292_16622 [Rhizopus microsporus]